jgi:hypothetical protein
VFAKQYTGNKDRMRRTWKTKKIRSRHPKPPPSITLSHYVTYICKTRPLCLLRNQNKTLSRHLLIKTESHPKTHLSCVIPLEWHDLEGWYTVQMLTGVSGLVSVKECTYSRTRLGMLLNSMSGMYRSRLLFIRLEKKETPSIINTAVEKGIYLC